MRKMGIPFHVNVRGRPIVARAFFTGQPVQSASRPKWSPNFAVDREGAYKK
ncbi:DUF4224 domain-containing protein [Paraburkholderia heleia]|uniref:DUF4224 domain-containing protein n=1 Tax=Paraburkholderia heleia TaxID=634127 RepID=UPI003898F8A9